LESPFEDAHLLEAIFCAMQQPHNITAVGEHDDGSHNAKKRL
jgi:hypothetical protein